MTIHLGSDHRGFKMKEYLVQELLNQGYSVQDHGNTHYDPLDDYTQFTFSVADAVAQAGDGSFGVVLCGSGVGVSIAANKVAGVRCVLGFSNEQVRHSRESDNCNIVALPSEHIENQDALAFVLTFIATSFDHEENDLRRLSQLVAREQKDL